MITVDIVRIVLIVQISNIFNANSAFNECKTQELFFVLLLFLTQLIFLSIFVTPELFKAQKGYKTRLLYSLFNSAGLGITHFED